MSTLQLEPECLPISLLLLPPDEPEPEPPPRCAACGGPVWAEQLAAYDAWDRLVHEECRGWMDW
jgi:hypothetical protein